MYLGPGASVHAESHLLPPPWIGSPLPTSLFLDSQSHTQLPPHCPRLTVAAAFWPLWGPGLGHRVVGVRGVWQCHPHPGRIVPQHVGQELAEWASCLLLIQKSTASGGLLSTVGWASRPVGRGDFFTPEWRAVYLSSSWWSGAPSSWWATWGHAPWLRVYIHCTRIPMPEGGLH